VLKKNYGQNLHNKGIKFFWQTIVKIYLGNFALNKILNNSSEFKKTMQTGTSSSFIQNLFYHQKYEKTVLYYIQINLKYNVAIKKTADEPYRGLRVK